MTRHLSTLLAVFLGVCSGSAAQAQEVVAAADTGNTPAPEAVDPLAPRQAAATNLNDFLWTNRAIVVFADNPADPRFQEQMLLLAERPDPLLERDVVIVVDTDPAARSDIRQEFRPRGFMLLVMTKDGNVGFRRPSPRDVREITRGIDNFAIRQEELRLGG